jgi:uncharacterized membrane protein YphA (DoxX/SURF4 family)
VEVNWFAIDQKRGLGGATKLLDFSAAAQEQEHFGLTPGRLWAVLAIIVGLGGSALVISGRLVWLGAGGLGVLTFIAARAFPRKSADESCALMQTAELPFASRKNLGEDGKVEI